VESITPAAMEKLAAYHWPGNVRELENVIERSLVMAAGTLLGTIRMPKIVQMRAQAIGLGVFGALLALVGLVMLLPGVRERVQDIFWFVAKVACFMYLYIWYRGTFPRYRFDQLMKVGWKVLLPMGLGVLILTAVVGMRQELLAAIVGGAR